VGLSKEKQTDAQPFPYPEATRSGAPKDNPRAGDAFGIAAAATPSSQRQEEEIREAARKEAEARMQGTFDESLQRLRDSIGGALVEFAKERGAYFRKVETEVVQLALSIARKVLHREAQVDPLLLAGMVRVALDQIESNTKVVLRVHPMHVADCRAYLAQSMEPQEVPQVEEDPTLAPEGCVLQTDLGTTELGIEIQFKEIEQGLMDLLAQRPQAGPR
jgi:flagellar assembly protein FliH